MVNKQDEIKDSDIILRKIRIKNFRSHKNTETTLEKLTLLIGTNNSGKTSFLRAINIALGNMKPSRDDLYYNQNENSQEIIIDLLFEPLEKINFEEYWRKIFGSDIVTDTTTQRQFLSFRTTINFEKTQNESNLKRFIIKKWGNDDIELDPFTATNVLQNICIYYIDAQRDLFEESKQTSSYFGKLVKQSIYDYEQNNTFEQGLENKLADVNKEIIENSNTLKHLVSHLDNLDNNKSVSIAPIPKKIRDIIKVFNIYFNDSNSSEFLLDSHGMGTRSYASLLTFSAFVNQELINKIDDDKLIHPILTLEEPEAHLHPNMQRAVYNRLKNTKGQKIISTHSPYIAGQAELNELRSFCKINVGVTKVNTIEITDREEKRKIQRMVINTRGEIFFSKIVVLFEGETEEQSIPIFAEKYFCNKYGKTPFELGINFIGCGGSNYKPFVQLLKDCNINWFIFSDYDKKTVKEDIATAIKIISYNLEDKNVDIDNCEIIPNTPSNVILLGTSFEKYLIKQNYKDNIIEALIEYKSYHFNEKQRENTHFEKEKKFTDEELIQELESHKTRYAVSYTTKIVSLEDKSRQIPPKIKDLFEAIDKVLDVKKGVNNNE